MLTYRATRATAAVVPSAKCKLRLLKLERVKDFLLLEEEFITNQERLKPKEQKEEVRGARGDGPKLLAAPSLTPR